MKLYLSKDLTNKKEIVDFINTIPDKYLESCSRLSVLSRSPYKQGIGYVVGRANLEHSKIQIFYDETVSKNLFQNVLLHELLHIYYKSENERFINQKSLLLCKRLGVKHRNSDTDKL